jgi:protein TonB
MAPPPTFGSLALGSGSGSTSSVPIPTPGPSHPPPPPPPPSQQVLSSVEPPLLPSHHSFSIASASTHAPPVPPHMTHTYPINLTSPHSAPPAAPSALLLQQQHTFFIAPASIPAPTPTPAPAPAPAPPAQPPLVDHIISLPLQPLSSALGSGPLGSASSSNLGSAPGPGPGPSFAHTPTSGPILFLPVSYIFFPTF